MEKEKLLQMLQKSNCRNSTQKVLEKHDLCSSEVQLRGNSLASLFFLHKCPKAAWQYPYRPIIVYATFQNIYPNVF